MSDEESTGGDEAARHTRLALLLAGVMSLVILTLPVLPCIDLPQHLAMATQLRRLWDGDAWATANLAKNLDTHNAGIAVFAAALGRVMPIELAGRVFLAAYPPLLVLGALRMLRARGLPAWRALLVLPATLGFSFAWGFANFCMGTALSFLALSLVAEQLRAPRVWRALLLALLSLGLGLTHVMAMLLTAMMAAAMGIEHLVRTRQRSLGAVARLVMAGAPLLLGCVYDLVVLFAHLSRDAGSYTSSPQGFEQFGVLRKLWWFGTLVSGMYGTFADTVLAWTTVLTLAAMAVAARLRPGRRGHPLVTPVLVLFAFYLAVPHVFVNTHLIFQRTAAWVVVAATFAIPAAGEAPSRRFARVAAGLGVLATIFFPLHGVWLAWETRGLGETLAAVPRGALLTGYIEDPRTAAIRMPVLAHAAALAVPRGAADEGYSFARLMGMPVVYQPGHIPPYPLPSWEHGAHPYRKDELLARRYPILLERAAWPAEATSSCALRLFEEDAGRARLLARNGAWLLWDTTGIGAR